MQKTYTIEINIEGSWMELPGHACSTKVECDDYVASLDPEGKSLRVVEIN